MILDTDRLQSDAAYREDMRHRFITDHFFAAEVIGFRDFSVRAHTPAVKLYGPKNPNIPMREQKRKKRLIHLDPRHTFKTSLKRVDRLQWICAFPEEITILNNSATQELSEAVSSKTSKAFFRSTSEGAKPLHLMFPELVVSKMPTGTWNTPCRRQSGAGDLDPTLAFTSPQSTMSGWHPFLVDYDDVEDTKNSGISAAPEVRQSVIDICDQNENLVRDGGFINIGGTRYHPFDYYGKCLERAKRNPEAWDVLVRPSLIVKSGARLVPGEFPAEDEVELLFGEFANLSYGELAEKFYANYESFMCQQQNDPQGGAVAIFDEKLYASCLIAPERVPFAGHSGQVYTCWRMAYGGKPGMEKYAEGAAAKVIDGKVYIIDCWQTTRTPSGLAEMMVQMHKQHQADGMMLLDTPGSEFMRHHIRNEAARKNVSINITWTWWDENDTTREAAIKQLEPMMKVGRIMFSTAMTKAAECHKQFVHFGLVKENGIAECVSKFADLVPVSQMRANMQEEELEYRRKQRDNAMMSQFLIQQGMPTVDDELRRRTEAHMAALQAATMHVGGPPLPGGLDG